MCSNANQRTARYSFSPSVPDPSERIQPKKINSCTTNNSIHSTCHQYARLRIAEATSSSATHTNNTMRTRRNRSSVSTSTHVTSARRDADWD